MTPMRPIARPAAECWCVMQRKTLAISTLVCGLVMLCGCGTPATPAAADEPKPTTQEAAARDATVLQAVFDDMSSRDNSESPAEWTRDQAKPIYVSKNTPKRRPDARQVLLRNDQKKWKALTNAQLRAAAEAANELVARADKGDPLPELKSTSGRLKIYEDAGAATRPAPENPFGGERASSVFLPGYSNDGRYALVRLGFPWSGRMHSGEATYLLERTGGGWKVLLRDFIYYV
jgi:hypothetical protein